MINMIWCRVVAHQPLISGALDPDFSEMKLENHHWHAHHSELLAAVRACALRENRNLTNFIESALRDRLSRYRAEAMTVETMADILSASRGN